MLVRCAGDAAKVASEAPQESRRPLVLDTQECEERLGPHPVRCCRGRRGQCLHEPITHSPLARGVVQMMPQVDCVPMTRAASPCECEAARPRHVRERLLGASRCTVVVRHRPLRIEASASNPQRRVAFLIAAAAHHRTHAFAGGAMLRIARR
jgi:hypothetical protein